MAHLDLSMFKAYDIRTPAQQLTLDLSERQLLRWRANIVGFEHAQIKMGHTRTPVTS